MGRFDEALGIARSVAIYRGIPFRQRRWRRLYRAFLAPGDLVFDVGGHVGNRARALLSMGCRVVIVEPQPAFANMLRRSFAGQRLARVLEAAVSNRPGRVELAISERTPTVSTIAPAWRTARAAETGFAGVRWNRLVEVEAVTLDELIERYGVPHFIKIDVEGAEPQVLEGLTRAVRALSFEYLPDDLDRAGTCVERLAALGAYRYNWSIGETGRLWSREWLDSKALLAALKTDSLRRRSGDVYAYLDT